MDWSMHRRVEHQASRMDEMMDRLGVDPIALIRLRQGEAYAEARTQCLFCTASGTCRRWLEEPMQPDAPPDFCPNLPIFQACTKTRSQR